MSQLNSIAAQPPSVRRLLIKAAMAQKGFRCSASARLEGDSRPHRLDLVARNASQRAWYIVDSDFKNCLFGDAASDEYFRWESGAVTTASRAADRSERRLARRGAASQAAMPAPASFHTTATLIEECLAQQPASRGAPVALQAAAERAALEVTDTVDAQPPDLPRIAVPVAGASTAEVIEFPVAGSKVRAAEAWTPPADEDRAAVVLAAGLKSNWQSRDLESFFELMNSRHAIVTLPNRVVISEQHQDGSVSLHAERDFKLKYRPYYRTDVGERGGERRTALADVWLRSPSRREYSDGIGFAPGGCSPRRLNLWTGWAVEPDPSSSCSLFLTHVRDVICAGDGELYGYLLGWFAHMVQFPGEKPGVGVVIRGSKGTGKDTVGEYVAKMIGERHAPVIGEQDHLVGKFNARLETALMLQVQEASWAGDRRGEAVLKYLVTSPRMEIERKGVDGYQASSVMRLFMTANAEWVVPASPDERRWCVLDASDARRGDTAYFSALRREMNGQGPAALLNYLQSYDLSEFDVRRPPRTGALLRQKLASLRGFDLWWFEALHDGRSSAMTDSDAAAWVRGALSVNRAALREDYARWISKRRHEGDPIDPRLFGKRLSAFVPDVGEAQHGTGSQRRLYVLPSLAECRRAFEQAVGGALEW